MPRGASASRTSSAKPTAFIRNVVPDRLDLRDRSYQPVVQVIPKPAMHPIYDLPVLYQGDCNGCTSFSLAKVLHYLLHASGRDDSRELLTDGAFYRCDKADCKCPAERRPIRAREMKAWFERKATRKLEKVSWDQIPKNSGWWAVFQFNETEYWGGHVIVLDTQTWQYYGTCSYPAWDQYAYQW